jgi:hypothetical protein
MGCEGKSWSPWEEKMCDRAQNSLTDVCVCVAGLFITLADIMG